MWHDAWGNGQLEKEDDIIRTLQNYVLFSLFQRHTENRKVHTCV